eukprot:ctg_2642.g451
MRRGARVWTDCTAAGAARSLCRPAGLRSVPFPPSGCLQAVNPPRVYHGAHPARRHPFDGQEGQAGYAAASGGAGAARGRLAGVRHRGEESGVGHMVSVGEYEGRQPRQDAGDGYAHPMGPATVCGYVEQGRGALGVQRERQAGGASSAATIPAAAQTLVRRAAVRVSDHGQGIRLPHPGDHARAGYEFLPVGVYEADRRQTALVGGKVQQAGQRQRQHQTVKRGNRREDAVWPQVPERRGCRAPRWVFRPSITPPLRPHRRHWLDALICGA